MKKLSKALLLMLSFSLLLCLVCFNASATEYTEGNFIYSVTDKKATLEGIKGSLSGEVIIPATLGGYPVESIGSDAFEYNSSITSVVIPDTVTEIGYDAFYSCSSLSKVILGENVRVILSDAFRFCSNLSQIDFPSTLESIGSNAFGSCRSLYEIEIPVSVTYVGSDAFYNTGYYEDDDNWTNDIALYLDGCLIDIPDYRYSGSTQINSPSSFKVKAGTRLIASGAFNSNITKITVPSGIEHICCDFTDSQKVYYPDIATLFKADTANCGGIYIGDTLLTSLIIPKGITEVPDSIFSGYEKLTSVTFSDTVKSIGEDSFSYTGLTSVTVPGNVQTIGKSAFRNCSALKKVTLGNGVKTVEARAFSECKSLEKITIPASLKKTGTSAFAYCFNLTKVYISNLKAWLNIDFGYDDTYFAFDPMSNPLCYDAEIYLNNKKLSTLVIPGGVKKIKKAAFVGADGINEVIIPEGVTQIGAGSFYFFNDYMESCGFIIPESVTSIGSNAFASTADVIYFRGSSKQWNKIKFGNYHETSSPAEYNYTADHIHKYTCAPTVTSKATLSANGKTKTKCSVCSATVTSTIYKIKTVALKETSVVCNGKNKTPSVIVKDSKGNVLAEKTDYTVKYSKEMKKPGKYTVTVTFKGKYEGSKKLTFKITLNSPALKFKSATSSSAALQWKAVTGAAKYEIYRLSGKDWKKVNSTEKTAYTVKGLKEGTVYKFKVRALYGDVKSSFSEVLTCETPTTAKKTTTVSAISQSTSAAMKYLKKNTNGVKTSNLIPGLKRTVTTSSYTKAITTCPSMTPQGMTLAGDYLLISAYCNCGNKHRSVIYVLNNKTQKYLTTVILDSTCHVGGIAKLGDYLWVCDSSQSDSKDKHILRAYKFSDIKAAIGKDYKTLSVHKNRTVDTKPSYMCAANGYLYVGTFSETSKTSTIYYYSVDGTKLDKKGSFKISGLAKIQGISIRGKYMAVTSSYGRENKSKVYIYKDNGKFKADGQKYTKPVKKFNFPNMLEACYIDKSQTYFLFESGAELYRSGKKTMPLDKYVSIANSKLGIK